MEGNGMILRVLPEEDSDAEELARWADQLLAELVEVDEADEVTVAPLTADTAPRGRRGWAR